MKQSSSQFITDIAEVFIEISKNSNLKYEFNHQRQCMILDRVLPGCNVYPGDYGFIEQTLELDNDPVDVLIFSEHSIMPGTFATVRIVGGLEMIDAGEVDNKLIALYCGDPATTDITDISQVNFHWKRKVWDFFLNYKKLENKTVQLKQWLNAKQAQQLLAECRQRFQIQKLPARKEK